MGGDVLLHDFLVHYHLLWFSQVKMGGSFAVFYAKGMQLRQHSTCCTTGLFAAWGCCCWDPEWSSATPPAGFLAGVPNERLRSSVAARSFTLKLNEKESSLHLIISGILPCSLATPTKNIPAVTHYKHNNNIIAVQGNWLSYPWIIDQMFDWVLQCITVTIIMDGLYCRYLLCYSSDVLYFYMKHAFKILASTMPSLVL